MSTGGFRKVGVEFIGDDSSLDAAWARQGAAAKEFATVSTEANAKTTAALVASTTKQIRSLQERTIAYRQAADAAAKGSAEQQALLVKAASAQSRLNTALGVSTSGYGRVGKAASSAEKDLSKAARGGLAGTGIFTGLGRSLAFASGGFLAFAGVTAGIRDAIQGADNLAKAQKGLDVAIQHTGGNLSKLGPEYAAVAKNAAQFGVSQVDATTGLQRATVLTGDAAKAQRAYQEALVVSKALGLDFNSALTATAKGQEGITTSLKRYGIELAKGATGQQQFTVVMSRFGGQALANTSSMDRFRAVLANTETTIGTALLPTLDKLLTSFGDWLQKIQDSGRLQHDVSSAMRALGLAFSLVEKTVGAVDKATGGFVHTLELLAGIKLTSIVVGWAKALDALAASWAGVAAEANAASGAQTRALATTEAGAAGAGASGAGGLAFGAGFGALASKLLGRGGQSGVAGRVGMYTGEGAVAGEAAGAASISATGIGALAVAAVLATAALTKLAQTTGDKLGAGSTYDKSLSALEGFFTGGLAGNSQFSPLHGLFGQILHGRAPFASAFQNTFGAPQSPLRPFIPFSQLQQQLGLSTGSLFGPKPTQFGVQPESQYRLSFALTSRETLAAAQAALTKGTQDDAKAAQQVLGRIKKLMAEGRLHGQALIQALGLEATALSTIWSNEQTVAQQRAKAAAAAETRFEAALDPLKLEVQLSRAQALGQSTVPALKALLGAAKSALASAKNLKDQKAAYDQIASLNQQIASATTQAAVTFTASLKLQLALAKDQALGRDQTKDLLKLKKEILEFIKTHRHNTQALIDAYNQLAQVNSQLGSTAQSALGLFKQASTAALTRGLGLTAAQRAALRARLSQVGPNGTVPGTGVGAAGYVIGTDGRPIVVHTQVNIDGQKVATSTTRHQQRHRRRNPTQRRGPNAGRG